MKEIELTKNELNLLNVIVFDPTGNTRGMIPRDVYDCGEPVFSPVAWAKKLDFTVTTIKRLFTSLALKELVMSGATINCVSYCSVTTAGFRVWKINNKGIKNISSTKEKNEMALPKKVENKKVRKATPTKKVAQAKKPAAKKAAAKPAAKKPGGAVKRVPLGNNKKPKVEKVVKNGIPAPGKDTISAKIWAIFDKQGKKVSRNDAVKAVVKAEFDKGTAGVQYRRWALFNGCYSKIRK